MRPRHLGLPDHALVHVGEVMHYLNLPRIEVLEHAIRGDLRLTYDGSMIHRTSAVELQDRLRLERQGVIRPA